MLMLSPLTIGQRYYVPRAALMAGSGWATVAGNPAAGVYVLRYPSGVHETLTDSR